MENIVVSTSYKKTSAPHRSLQYGFAARPEIPRGWLCGRRNDDSVALAAAASLPISARATAERQKELSTRGDCGGAQTGTFGRAHSCYSRHRARMPGAKIL